MLMMSNDEMDPAEITPHLSLVCNCKIINFFFLQMRLPMHIREQHGQFKSTVGYRDNSYRTTIFSKTTNSKLPQFYLQRERTP